MKIYHTSKNESYNYGNYIVQVEDDGFWYVYDAWTKDLVDGPFDSWLDAENHIDELGED